MTEIGPVEVEDSVGIRIDNHDFLGPNRAFRFQ